MIMGLNAAGATQTTNKVMLLLSMSLMKAFH